MINYNSEFNQPMKVNIAYRAFNDVKLVRIFGWRIELWSKSKSNLKLKREKGVSD